MNALRLITLNVKNNSSKKRTRVRFSGSLLSYNYKGDFMRYVKLKDIEPYTDKDIIKPHKQKKKKKSKKKENPYQINIYITIQK